MVSKKVPHLFIYQMSQTFTKFFPFAHVRPDFQARILFQHTNWMKLNWDSLSFKKELLSVEMSQDPRCQLDFAQIFIRISSTLPTCPRPFIPWPRSKCALMRDNQRNTLHTPVCGYKSRPIIWICPSISLSKPKTPKCVFDLLICQMAVSIVDLMCWLM